MEDALANDNDPAGDPPERNLSEDSDAWLDVSPDELDGIMQAASGGAPGVPQDGNAELGEEHAKVLSDLAERVNGFVEGKGDLDGARFEEWVERMLIHGVPGAKLMHGDASQRAIRRRHGRRLR